MRGWEMGGEGVRGGEGCKACGKKNGTGRENDSRGKRDAKRPGWLLRGGNGMDGRGGKDWSQEPTGSPAGLCEMQRLTVVSGIFYLVIPL